MEWRRDRMTYGWRLLLLMAGAVCAGAAPLDAQQQPGGWQPQTSVPAPAPPAWAPVPAPVQEPPATLAPPPNTTIVPRSPTEPRADAGAGGPGQVSLVALLTADGQSIEHGLVWRVYHDKPGPDGKARMLSAHREPSPTLRLEPGDYMITVAFGRAHLTRKISVGANASVQERFVLNAGGLRLTPALVGGEPVNDKAVSYDIFSDERDQYGQRTKVMSAVKPGLVIRLNAGIYSIVGVYGDANAIARADVTVEAGKLTEATLKHAAARVTFKLVASRGGDAIADTQWSVANALGETVKESAGALPTHILAPGTYTVSARHAGQDYHRDFTVHAGQSAQVEVVMR